MGRWTSSAGWTVTGALLLALLAVAWAWLLTRQVRAHTEALRQAERALSEHRAELKQSRDSLARAQALAAIVKNTVLQTIVPVSLIPGSTLGPAPQS